MSKLKLGVDVINAQNLLPKDGQGSSNPLLELYFDGQRLCTSIKNKDLNPVWNESFYFNISNPLILTTLTLEASIYSVVLQAPQSRTFLGKISVAGTSFVPYSDAVVLNYSLEKNRVFSSRVRGEVALKVYVTNDPSIKLSKLVPEANHQRLKELKRHTFHHLPNPKLQQPVVNNAPDPVMSMHEARKYGVTEEMIRERPQTAQVIIPTAASERPDYALKETSPYLGGGRVIGGRVIRGNKTEGTYDLVERMHFLYVRVVKARDLPVKDITGSLDPFVEIKVGNYKGITRHLEKNQNPEWHVVFAFSRDQMQATVVEIRVKDKDFLKDDFVGLMRFDLNEVPLRVPPDSPLAPEWYRLVDKNGDRIKGELMLAMWIGTQADEAFSDATHSDSVTVLNGSHSASVLLRSKVYHAPRLWYLRVNVIEAQDVVTLDKTRTPDVYVKANVGHQILRTKTIQDSKMNPFWNEDLVFVAAEPFDEHIILTLEDRIGVGKDEILGRLIIPLNSIEKRADDRPIHTKWYNFEKPVYVLDVDELKKEKFSTRVHLRVCLDGGYHVLDESTCYSSDLRPTAKQLCKPAIGCLELGILNAVGLNGMKTRDGKATSDTYCVAKYGHKWVRTRTVVDNLNPKFNEQYTWDVFDPATVLTIGVFHNSQLGDNSTSDAAAANGGVKDVRVGKVRIRISTLETRRVYTHSYPMLVLHPTGVKKMGELHLAIRFTCTSFANMMYVYSKPLLPKMHYARPFNINQVDILRHHAVHIVATRLGRAEPPLRKEVIEYMSDSDSHLWSLRRSKANLARVMSVFSGLFAISNWFKEVCLWRNPITTVLVHVLYLMLVCFPELILPTLFLYMFLIGVWNFRYRPRYPPHMNIRLSQAESIHPDEMDEEFDTFPTTKNPDLVRMRYDRLRSVAGRLQTVIGDIATQCERMQSLLSWRDPRATSVAVTLCLVAALVFYVTPIQVIAGLAGVYMMRHPRFRHYVPSVVVNFFRRLPAQTDCML